MTDHVFGIDLGTTYSAIAHINDYDQPEVIRNREGDETTPSVVFLEGLGQYVVGKEAKNGAVVHREQTVSLIKRQMGNRIEMDFFGEPFFPETISAIILKDLADYAREATGSDARDVVITVPAYFGMTEKEATRQAGSIAGLNVVGIIAEPVAAALSAGFKAGDADKTLLVYDLGGGTFDCTVMRLSASGVEVLVTDGNRLLGGADWDALLFDLVADKFRSLAGLDEDPTSDEDFAQRLLTEVEGCKMTLSRKERASVKCSFGSAFELVEVTREEFESVTRHLVEETLDIVARAMEAARTKVTDLSYDEVLLVGGSSRMPMIERGLRERFGWSLTKTEYDLAVAKGAALYGQGIDRGVPVLAPGEQPSPAPRTFTIGADAVAKTITNVLPKGIGLELVRDGAGPDDPEHYIGFLAHSQQPLPWEVLQTVETYSDNTTELTIHIFEQAGERESEVVADNKEITPETGATFTRLPALPKGSPIDVRLAIDSEGLSTLRAFEPKSAQELQLTVRLAVLQAEDEEKAKELVQGVRLPSRAE